ncbi:MAG TPA: ABC transporter permease [Candidatus Bathyarchaeota archaeon]|nr:ABC transporter permease [Candidatus Bathyarchaeota archaeon]
MLNISVLKYCLKFAWNDMATRKTRSALTILGISVGISALIALMSIMGGMRYQIEDRLNRYFGVGVRLGGKGEMEVPDYLAESFKMMNMVSDAYPTISGSGLLGGQNVFILGIPAGKLDDYLSTVQFISGGKLNETDKGYILVSNGLMSKGDLKIGDRVEVYAFSSGKKDYFTIKGVFDPGLSFGNIGLVVMKFKEAQKLFDTEGYASEIVIKLASNDQIDPFINYLKKLLPDAKITTSKEILSKINEILDIINVTLLTIASISLIVAALSVMNTIMTVVRDRIREIGILKAIGATRSHILSIFLGEVLILSFLGGIFGIIGGSIASRLMSDAFGRLTNIYITPLISVDYILAGLSVSISVGLLSGFYPSWKGANIRPIEALRYE